MKNKKLFKDSLSLFSGLAQPLYNLIDFKIWKKINNKKNLKSKLGGYFDDFTDIARIDIRTYVDASYPCSLTELKKIIDSRMKDLLSKKRIDTIARRWKERKNL